MRKIFLALAITATALPASAAQIVFSSGKTVRDNGQVSDYSGQAGLVEERFGYNTALSSCVQTRASTVQFSGLGPFGGAELTMGATRNKALPPGTNRVSLDAGVPIADTSCYAVVPDLENRANTSSVTVDIAPASKSPILYFGFYWGSLDSYNSIKLESRQDKTGIMAPIFFNGLTQQPDGTISGSDLQALLGVGPGYNTYVSFRFSAAENFQRITFGSSNRGFETDNYAYSVNDFLSTPPAGSTVVGVAPAVVRANLGVNAVPEPAAVGVLGAALGMLAIARRRRAA